MLVIQALNAAEDSFDSVGANHVGSVVFARILGKLPGGKCKETDEYICFSSESSSVYAPYAQLKGIPLSQEILKDFSTFFGDQTYTVFGDAPNVGEFFTPTETAFTAMYAPLADFSYVPDDSLKAVWVRECEDFFDVNLQDFVTITHHVWHKNSMTPEQCMNLYSHLYLGRDIKFFLLFNEEGSPVSARMHLYFLHNGRRVSQGWHGCVPDTFRGKGYGPTLMKYAMSRDRDNGVDVFINEAAPAAVSAWSRAGLRDSGKRIVEYTKRGIIRDESE